jgi:hypothetical protein
MNCEYLISSKLTDVGYFKVQHKHLFGDEDDSLLEHCTVYSRKN